MKMKKVETSKPQKLKTSKSFDFDSHQKQNVFEISDGYQNSERILKLKNFDSSQKSKGIFDFIGYAKNKIKKQGFGGFKGKITEIILERKYARGLVGLKDYSHIIILFWMNEAEGIVRLKHRPQGNPKVPVVGIFATRCQWRPNCIGISTVPLISINKNIIKVSGLDVIDNTPILDIKPYVPSYDKAAGKIKLPGWEKELVYK